MFKGPDDQKRLTDERVREGGRREGMQRDERCDDGDKRVPLGKRGEGREGVSAV